MTARSLISLLVAAAVALQSCAAAVVEDGYYLISNSDRGLFPLQASEGYPVIAVPNSHELWQVENKGGDNVLIRDVRSRLLLSSQQLAAPGSKVIVTSKESIWHLRQEQGGAVVIEEPHGTGLVVTAEGNQVKTQPYYDEGNQGWRFEPRSFKHETQHRCGPWRLESDSLYVQ
jgi:hypothetical protein